MEEILASIRRIIADDDHEPVRRPGARRDDVLPDVKRGETPRAETARAEPARPAAPRPEAGRVPPDDLRMERVSADRAFAPRVDPVRGEFGGPDGARHEPARPLTPRPSETLRPDAARAEMTRPLPPRVDPVRGEGPRTDTPRHEPPRAAVPNGFGPRLDSGLPGSALPDLSRTLSRTEADRADPARPAMMRPESARLDGAPRDAGRSQAAPVDASGARPLRFDPAQPDAARHESDAQMEGAQIADARRQQDGRRPVADDAVAFADLYGSEGAAALARQTPIRDMASAPPVAEAPQPTPRAGLDARPVRSDTRRKDLLSPAVDAAVMAAFESLGDVTLGQAALPQQGRTVEDLIKEILRPMLKTWLDDHLPDIVERLVRAEIERVARTGR